MFDIIFKTISKRKKKKPVDTTGYVTVDENYFKELDECYIDSPTATMAMLKFYEHCQIVGIDPKLINFWDKITNDFLRYGWFVVNVKYDIEGNIVAHEYKKPRQFVVSEEDDNGNASKYKNTVSGVVYPKFDDNKSVVMAQIKSNGYDKFFGQIYMYNDTSLPYRITPFYSVKGYMKVEADSAIYGQKASDNAMFGNSIFITKKSSDSSARELEVLNELKEALTESKGVENTAQNLLLEYSGDIDDVTKLIHKVSISNDVNVDLFNGLDDRAENKICLACYNFPKLLMFKETSVFGNSGESIEVAISQWDKTCKREANAIKTALESIGMQLFKETTPETL